MSSVVLIIPATLRIEANRLADLKGWGSNCYTIPLTDGTAPVSHWGLRTTVQAGFLAEMAEAAGGVMPEIDMEPGQFFGVIAAVIFDHRGDPTGHFDDVCSAHGLTKVEPSE